jgi:hypothetical protein
VLFADAVVFSIGEGSAQPQADPASESNQFLVRFAKAEIPAPAR